jgi:hypothetical protein
MPLIVALLNIMAEGGKNLRISPFTAAEDHIATGDRWDDSFFKMNLSVK